MSIEKKIVLSRECKSLLLSVLKNGYITEQDVRLLAKNTGIDPVSIEIEVIDRTDQVEGINRHIN